MKLFPWLLAGLLLALLGGIGWQLLREQEGLLVVQWGEHIASLRAEVAVLLWLLATLALLGLFALLRLPFRAMRRYARRLARERLGNGLLALQQGRPERAETLLSLAAQRASIDRVPALLHAIAAAKAAGLAGRLREHRIALSRLDPLTGALELAAAALEEGRAIEALATLETAAARSSLPPAGLRLKAEALARLGRADEALPMVARLRAERGHDGAALAALETRLAVAALADAAEASTLLIRWKGLAPALRAQTPVLLALARRASLLHVEAQAEQALAEALEARWDEAVVEAWGQLPAFVGDARLARAETWLPAHPSSPGLLRALGRLSAAAGQPARAEAWLHRALAQGAGSAAWEDLGDLLAAAQDPRAAQAYANALRLARGEPARELPGRGLRERIGDAATAEERDEFGHPRLPAA
ncbi:MAG: heme biosynthesis protein HemY [Xanthomonadaceae bacterium]|nr:heme biosynthesis protein HemY [Xanthomonadaceae bacterium]